MKHTIRKCTWEEAVEFEQYYILYIDDLKKPAKYYTVRAVERAVLFYERVEIYKKEYHEIYNK